MFKHVLKFLFPEAQINVPGEVSDERLGFAENLPAKRQSSGNNDLVQKKRKMFELSDTDQESIKALNKNPVNGKFNSTLQTIPEIIKKPKQKVEKTIKYPKNCSRGVQFSSEFNKTFSFPPNILNSLPSTKRKLHSLKILPSDSQQCQFNKIYQQLYPSNTYSNSEFLITSSRKQIPKTEIEEKSLNDSISIVTDSFVTPEDSPLLQASPTSTKISKFELESPLNNIKPISSIEGWGKLKDSNIVCSPFFPTNKEPISEIKPNILFLPIPEVVEESKNTEKLPEKTNEAHFEPKKTDQDQVIEPIKVNEMELLLSKENSNMGEHMEVIDKSIPLVESTEFGEVLKAGDKIEFSIGGSSMSSSQADLSTSQTLPSNKISPFSSTVFQDTSNPFLNISQATVSTPKYVFGSGNAKPQAYEFGSANPFLTNPFK